MSASWLQPAELAAGAVLARLREAAQAGWLTGLGDLDSVTGGLQKGCLWALTGRPGAGKSLLALGLARELTLKQDQKAVFVARREPTEMQTERLLAAEAKVGLHHLRHGQQPSDDEWTRLEAAAAGLAGKELHLAQATLPAQNVLSLKHRPALKAPQLVVVDDIASDGQRLAQLRDLHGLAGRLQCAVLAVLAPDLREPGAAEEEAALVADVVMRLENCSGDRAGEADLVVTHNRRGPICRIVLGNQMHYARFVDPIKTSGQPLRQ